MVSRMILAGSILAARRAGIQLAIETKKEAMNIAQK